MYVGGAPCFEAQDEVQGVSTMELQLQALMINHHHQNLVDFTYSDDRDHRVESSWGSLHDNMFDFTNSLHQGFNSNATSGTTNASSLLSHQMQPELVFNLMPSSLVPDSSTMEFVDPVVNQFSVQGDEIDDACTGQGRTVNGKRKKPLSSERQRREELNSKFQDLRDLVPNPIKSDKASIVGEAIDYIKNLVGTVEKLRKMVEKKRFDKFGDKFRKRPKTEDEDVDVVADDLEDYQSYNGGSSKSSWLQKKSNGVEVDVRVMEDEVTIKVVLPRKIDCLLLVSKVLDDLHLDVQNVSGGLIGDFYSFLFNTKIYEGYCVYASAVANKLISVLDDKLKRSGVTSIEPVGKN